MFPSFIALSGMVHGGQQGVSGATIQLYAAGATGYGSAATAFLTKTVTTDAAGSFTITGDYTCPTASTQVYIVATGGNPGLSPGTNNAALAMMAALGPCGNLTSSTFIFIDEVTTVASVYALAPFMSAGGGTKLGTSSTNAKGLANAFATVNNLVNTAKGTAPGPESAHRSDRADHGTEHTRRYSGSLRELQRRLRGMQRVVYGRDARRRKRGDEHD